MIIGNSPNIKNSDKNSYFHYLNIHIINSGGGEDKKNG